MTLKDLSLADLQVAKNALSERFFNYPEFDPPEGRESIRDKIKQVEYEITTKVNSIDYSTT